MTADELQQIFGPLFQLLPLHEGQVCSVWCVGWDAISLELFSGVLCVIVLQSDSNRYMSGQFIVYYYTLPKDVDKSQ